MEKKTGGFIYWTPRILSILFVVFLALFSLDIFDMALSFWETVVGLAMHNIPAFTILVLLIISWKHEMIGGVLFILAGAAYIVGLLITILQGVAHQWYMLTWSLYIAGPAFLIGILFIIGRMRKKEDPRPDSSR
jgi:hypothetical protein